jgi:hypothetical protein
MFRPIQRKEVILTELPHVAGPSRERHHPVCVECLVDLTTGSDVRACVCGLPLCARQGCSGNGPNHRAECDLLQRVQPGGLTDGDNLQRLLDDLLPLRKIIRQFFRWLCFTFKRR